MYLGYQKGKAKFYTVEPLDEALYNIDNLVFTEDEYVLEGDEYVIKDAAWEERERQRERERIAKLSLTRGDVFRGLLQAKGVTKTQLRANIEAMPEGMQKEMALIDFDEALNFYRGNPLVDTVGALLGITSEQLDKFFETNDYHELEAEETPQNGEENIGEDNSTQTEETLENTPDFGTENEDLDKGEQNDNQDN